MQHTILGFAFEEGGPIHLQAIKYDRKIVYCKSGQFQLISDLYHDGNKLYSFMMSRPRQQWIETDSIEDLGVHFVVENETPVESELSFRDLVGGGWFVDQIPDNCRFALAMFKNDGWQVCVYQISDLKVKSVESILDLMRQLTDAEIVLPLLQTKKCHNSQGVYWVG